MLDPTPLPDLPRGTRLMGGWTVGAPLPRLGDGLLRAVAERADGRRAVLEAGLHPGTDLGPWLDEFVEEIELWGDTHAFLPVLAGGRVESTRAVIRIVAPPRGRVLTSAGRTPAVETAVQAATALAQAVATAHARGLVHGSLHPGRVHLLANGVEVEPGGFDLALKRARGGNLPTRADDVKAVAELLLVMVGVYDGEVPSSLPQPMRVVLQACLDPDPFERPDAPDLVAALRQVGEGLTPGATSDRATPVTANRTVAPRLGVVDVTLPPAAPPVPEVRSLAPAGEREVAPTTVGKAEQRRRTVEYMVGALVLLVVAYVAWWFLG